MPDTTPDIQASNNRRIAKNTIFLYIRMALSTLVSLYTSRVVLRTLGVEDYGVYTLVGGIVVMFQFLNSSLSGATSRFLTFELGKSDKQKLKDTFSTALIAHLLIAAFVFVVAETAGLWFLSTKLVIPDGRMYAAQIVYQCSILSLMVSFTQVPYNASIISHEDMDVFAYIELLSVFLRLGIVYLLVIGNFDKLILYAILVLVVSVTIAMIYRIYAVRHYEECHFHFIWKPAILKPMLTFSGWNLFASASSSIRQFGVNSIINIFFGVVYNAAGGIALTVGGAVTGFCTNVITAFRPQIIKQYAQNRVDEMMQLMTNASKYSILLFSAVALPLCFELPYILHIWLGEAPPKTIEFVRMLIVSTIPFELKEIIKISIYATAKIKIISLTDGCLSLLVLAATYCSFHLGHAIEFAYIWLITQRIMAFICALYILKKIIPSFPIKRFLIRSLFGYCLITLGVIVALYFLVTTLSEGYIRLCITSIVSVLLYACHTYIFVLDENLRKSIHNRVLNILR